MSRVSRTSFLLLLLVSLVGCDNAPEGDDLLDEQLREALAAASEGRGLDFFLMPASGDYAAIPQDPRNPITEAKVALGRLLYHETGLAVNAHDTTRGMAMYSCASCHHVAAGFQAGVPQGIGEGGRGFGRYGEGRQPNPDYPSDMLDIQPVRSPTTLNTAWQEAMLWNGQFGATGVNAGTEAEWTAGTPIATNHLGFEGLETQAIAGLSVHRMQDGAAALYASNATYRALFDAAFPELPAAERATRETAGLAIAAYERTLLANEAPFQRWLRGETGAMTSAQKRGAVVFFEQAQCATCHTGPALNSMTFHALGMNDLAGPGVFSDFNPKDPVRLGRYSFTQQPGDEYKFKTPQLYNLADVHQYGHGATFSSIRDVVEYKVAGVPENDRVPTQQLAEGFRPLGLTRDEVDDLVTFLESGLRDRSLYRYVPDALPTGYCFPNNDAQSRRDLGCD